MEPRLNRWRLWATSGILRRTMMSGETCRKITNRKLNPEIMLVLSLNPTWLFLDTVHPFPGHTNLIETITIFYRSSFTCWFTCSSEKVQNVQKIPAFFTKKNIRDKI